MKYIFFILTVLSFSCSSQSIDENIILVNAGTAGRDSLADLINQINQFKPKVIAIDYQFSSEGKKDVDTRLVNALNSCENLVLVSIIDDYSSNSLFHKSFKLGCLPNLRKNAKTGFANMMLEDGDSITLKRFSQLEYVDGKVELSFALRTAYEYDSVKTKRYMLTHENYNTLNLKNGLKQFKRFSIADFFVNEVRKSDIKDKIVMIGFLGPGNEDKFFVPITGPKHLNIYGLEFHAEIVSEVLER